MAVQLHNILYALDKELSTSCLIAKTGNARIMLLSPFPNLYRKCV